MYRHSFWSSPCYTWRKPGTLSSLLDGRRRFKTYFPMDCIEGKITRWQIQRQHQKRSSEHIGNFLRTIWSQDQTVVIAVIELKWLFQGSMTLKQFITKATFLMDEAGYPARHNDRMVCDTLIAGISYDIVHGKIIKKGPNITLAQVLEISGLETAT